MDFCDFSELCASAPYAAVMTDDLDVGALLGDPIDPLWTPLSPLPAFAALATTLFHEPAQPSAADSANVPPPEQEQPRASYEARFSPYAPDVYNVEYIVKHKNRPTGRTYLVKWEGWPSNYNSWVKREDFCTDDMPAAYEQALEEARRQRRQDRQRQRQRRKRTFDAATATPTASRFERACKRQRSAA